MSGSIRPEHSYNNKFYFIELSIKHSIAQQKIELRKTSHGQFNAWFAGRKLMVSEVVEPAKISMEELEVKKKLEILALADNLGNVTEASRLSGVSRDTIYVSAN